MSVSHLAGAGDVLGDRYTLRSTEWSSALGSVWVARDSVLDRRILVQVLAPRLAGDAKAKRAFQKAAARTAQVTHPGVLQVFDIGEDPPFVVFEYAPSRLQERLAAGRLTPTEAARAVLALARGLEALHAAGESHGSISPSSVTFDEEGRAKLFANGAIAVSRDAAENEQPAGYRPPEGNATSQELDRYALAALLHHMVTGGAPGESTRHRPAGIDELLARALSATPAARPSLPEFIAALAPYARVTAAEIRGPRRSTAYSSDFRWLGAVAVIVVLAAIAVILGPGFVRDLARRSTPKPSARATTTLPTGPIEVAAVSDYDPPPAGDGAEHSAEVGRVTDGDALTNWETEGYARATFGHKTGVGLRFDFGSVRGIRHINVQTSRAGWRAEVKVSDILESELKTVTSFTSGTQTTVPLPAGTKGRYLVLWITNLVDDGSGSDRPFRASVSEVSFFSG